MWAPTAAGRGGIGVNQAIATLARETRNYVSPVSGGVRRDDAGRLALVALAARQAGQRPASFGGMNLVARLQLTRRCEDMARHSRFRSSHLAVLGAVGLFGGLLFGPMAAVPARADDGPASGAGHDRLRCGLSLLVLLVG